MRSVCWRMVVLVLLGLGLTGCMWLFPPLQAVLVATIPNPANAPLTVQFNLSGSTGPITKWTLLTPGASQESETGTVPPPLPLAVVRTYTSPGMYTATLTVQDARGRTSSAQFTFTLTLPLPTASLGAVAGGTLSPGEVQFTVSATPAAYVVYWKLDFGHAGNYVSGATLPTTPSSYTYPVQTASYTAVLEVRDVLNRLATDQKVINVDGAGTVTFP